MLTATLASMAASVPVRRTGGPVRLPIDRVFSMKGFGTVVTGTLVSGRVAIDQSLVVLPQQRVAKVRGLQVHGRSLGSAEAGSRVALNLGGVEVSDIARGDTLADRDAFEPTRRFDARLDLLPDARPLRQGARVRFHCGTVEVLGRVALAVGPPPGATYARIHLESPAVVTRGDRFILRAYSPLATIGGGVVLDPRPPRVSIRSPGWRRSPAAAGHAHARCPEDVDVALAAVRERSRRRRAGAVGGREPRRPVLRCAPTRRSRG